MMKKSLFGIAMVFVLMVAVTAAYAHGPGYGRGGYGPGAMMGPGNNYHGGYGPGAMMGPGNGWHGGYGPGHMWGADGNGQVDEESAKLFNQLHEKANELNQALSASEVDEAKVKALQAEINKLRNDLSERRVSAELEFRKNNPDYRPGYGRGGYGPGYCWR